MDSFFHRAERGELPALTWIGPREGVNKSLGPAQTRAFYYLCLPILFHMESPYG
jgi:hypothetical protein